MVNSLCTLLWRDESGALSLPEEDPPLVKNIGIKDYGHVGVTTRR